MAVYTVDEAPWRTMTRIWKQSAALSKSKAKAVADDGVMAYQATATIVRNEKTGEELEYYTKLKSVRPAAQVCSGPYLFLKIAFHHQSSRFLPETERLIEPMCIPGQQKGLEPEKPGIRYNFG